MIICLEMMHYSGIAVRPLTAELFEWWEYYCVYHHLLEASSMARFSTVLFDIKAFVRPQIFL